MSKDSCVLLGGRTLHKALSSRGYSTRFVSSSEKTLTSSISADSVVLAASPHLAQKKYKTQIPFVSVLSTLDRISAKRLLVLSSASVYGLSSRDKTPFAEHMELGDSVSVYAAEKIALEKAARGGNFQEVLILRPSGFYGVWPQQPASNLIDTLLEESLEREGRAFSIEHQGRQIRDFCYFPALVDFIGQWISAPGINRNLTLNFRTTKPEKISRVVEFFAHTLTDLVWKSSSSTDIHSELDDSALRLNYPKVKTRIDLLSHLESIIAKLRSENGDGAA